MDIIRARKIIRSLAEGVDPFTGELLPRESIFNSPDVIRALYTVWEATSPKPGSASAASPNAGKPWTSAEDDKLREEFAEKLPISEIAREHGRSYGAIESRLEHLGLKRKHF